MEVLEVGVTAQYKLWLFVVLVAELNIDVECSACFEGGVCTQISKAHKSHNAVNV